MLKALKRRINGASFEELLGVMDTVTRPEAKALARLHGHPWAKVIRELHRRARAGFVVPSPPPEPDPLAEAINAASSVVARYGAPVEQLGNP